MSTGSWLHVVAIVVLGTAVYWSVIYTGLFRLDETIMAHRWYCHRCPDPSWFGTSKICERCGSRALHEPPPPPRPPAVWQEGHDHGRFTEIDTQPIRIPRHRAP